MTKFATAALLLFAAPALGQDDKAPPYTPPVPSAGSPASSTLTEERVAAIVDQAITRAMARSAAAPLASAQGYAPAMASPQAAYQPPPQPFTSYLATSPAAAPAQQINVLVPPGPLHRACARLGEHMAAKGHPRVKTMTIAPQATIPTYTLTPAPTPVAQAPTQYTPTVPAQLVQPTPPAPVKASAQR